MEENVNKIIIKNVKKIVWEIDNFSSHSEIIESPKFEIDDANGDKTKWFLKIWPKRYREYTRLCVELAESEDIEVPVRIELAILDSNGEETHKTVTRTTIYGGIVGFAPDSHLKCPEDIKRHFLLTEENGLLTKDKLTIVCNIDFDIEQPIDNFSSHSEIIESPKFEIDDANGDKTKWFLKIWPKRYREYTRLCVELAESEDIEVAVRIELAILDSNGEETHKTVTRTTIYGGIVGFAPDSHLKCPEDIKRHFLLTEENGLLTKDKLTIVCNIDFDIEQPVSPVDTIQIPLCQLSADFANLLKSGILADLVLISSDNKEFKVHKIILACRSPVFATMIQQNGMTGTTTNKLKIEDIQANVLDKILHFIYTGDAPNIGAMAKELLAAADKYQIGRLKVLCVRSLVLSLDSGNACELLVLADLHSAAYLKSEASQFIKSNAEEVIKTDGWKWLATEHSRLVVPLLRG